MKSKIINSNTQDDNKVYSFVVFNITVWICFYGALRVLQTFIYAKPIEYLIIDISDTILGIILCFGIRPLLEKIVAKTTIKMILIVITCAFISAIIWTIIHNEVYQAVFPHQPDTPFGMPLLKGIRMPFYVFVVWCAAFAYWRNNIWGQQEKQKRIETELASQQIQLKALQNQLTPHFLFNAINCVYANALKENATDTQESLLSLSNLLRYAGEDSTDSMVPLEKELEFIQDYLSIEQKRFGDRLNVQVNNENSISVMTIPKMLIQPLVENVIQHVVQNSNEQVNLKITLSQSEDNLSISVANDIPEDLQKKHDKGLGSGLKNLRHRLKLIYNNNARLIVTQSEQQFAVTIELPL